MTSCPKCTNNTHLPVLQCTKCKAMGCKNCWSAFCKACGYSDIRPI